MATREKRFLPTLLDMLDARGKTILEAWHTEVNGRAFGVQEQRSAGNFSSTQPFIKFSNRALDVDEPVIPDDGNLAETPLGSSNSENKTWPNVSSISFEDYYVSADQVKPRTLEEMWYSGNEISFNSPTSNEVDRVNVTDSLSDVFGSSVVADRDYKLKFLRATAASFANVPDKNDVKDQGEDGFNVGQVQPFDPFTTGSDREYTFGDKREQDIDPDPQSAAILRTISQYERQLLRIRPGANRINLIFNVRENLDIVLRQNLLMPSDIDHDEGGPVQQQVDFAEAIEAGTVANINDDTFTKLYLANRSALHGESSSDAYQRTPAGTIGGRAIADLQGPQYSTEGNFTPDDNYRVFSFEEDKDRANQYTLQEGFIDNVAGNGITNITKGLSTLLPAVVNDQDTLQGRQDKTSLLKTIEKMDSQAFPFMFETVNKHGAHAYGTEYKQYCFLQATLQSLSESYAPSWSSKHFFGRTEQTHTYTMTDRTIDLSFVIFATEIRRLQNLYERITWLAQQTYASYDESKKLKSGPLIRMSIGDMFAHLTGFIRSLSFDWSYLGPGGKWEISQGLRIPMACSVQMNFTVIHDDMPDRNYAFYPGPLHHPNGLVGTRGTTSDQPNGGPLIGTANRRSAINGATNTLSEERETELFGLGRTTHALSQRRDAQYIDQLNHNMSAGDQTTYERVTQVGSGGAVERTSETDFIF